MSHATSHTTGTIPDPPTPGWRELRALWPLLLLVALVVGWAELQFASALSAISASAVVAVVAGILKWLPESTESSAKLSLANSLKSHTLTRRLWRTSAILLVGTLLLGTVRVSADEHAARTRIYRIDPTGGSTAKDASASAQLLDGKSAARYDALMKQVDDDARQVRKPLR